jgi:hypothetical protein
MVVDDGTPSEPASTRRAEVVSSGRSNMNFTATGVSSVRWVATHTEPIPPRRSGSRRRYLPPITASGAMASVGPVAPSPRDSPLVDDGAGRGIAGS